TSDQIGPGASTGSERPIALRAWMRTTTALPCPLPGVATVQVVAMHVDVPTTSPPGATSEMSYPVIGELLKPPAPNTMSSVPSPNPVTCAPVTGSGRSCTEMVTVPQAYRLGSSVASATWYWRVVLIGAAVADTVTSSVERSSLGWMSTPSGRLSPRPRTPTT